jgi:hypothetical protein
MRRVITLVSCAMAAVVITMTVAAFSCLYLMFSTRESNIRKEGLFGSVYFQAKDTAGGVTNVSVGIADVIPLLIIWLLLLGFAILTRVMYLRLVAYRQGLLVRAGE